MKNLRRGSGLVLGLLWVLIADLATAGDYVLLVGKGFEVCEAYLKNLNSFPKHPPMVCDRPLNPKLTEFSKPQWQPVDILQNLDLLRLVEQTLRGLTDEQFEAKKEEWLAQTREAVERHLLTLSTARLDVDRDGEKETVVRYEEPSCNPVDQGMFGNPYGRKFYVLSADQRHLDSWKSGNFGLLGGRPDIILYQGNVYISGWAGGLHLSNGQLSLQTPLHVRGMDTEVCDYTYQPSHPRRRS